MRINTTQKRRTSLKYDAKVEGEKRGTNHKKGVATASKMWDQSKYIVSGMMYRIQ